MEQKKQNKIACYLFFCCSLIIVGCHSQPANYAVPQAQPIQPPCQQEEAVIMPSALLSPDKLLAEFKKIGTIKPKTEFETDEDFYRRVQAFKSNPIFSNTFWVAAEKSFSSARKIEYNPYNKCFTFKTTPYGINIANGFASFEILPMSFLLMSNATANGSYTGSNIFGATARVTKINRKEICINVVNISSVYRSPLSEKVDRYPTAITGVTMPINQIEAEKISKNLEIVFEVSPSARYIDKQNFGAISKVDGFSSPTIRSPYESSEKTSVLFVNIIAVHLVDITTKKIYGTTRIE